MGSLQRFLFGCLELVAPQTCVACDEPLERPSYDHPASDLEGNVSERMPNVFCDACQPLIEPCSRNPGAFEYGGPLADAIKRMKYSFRPDLARPLGRLMIPRALRYAGEVDSVVPVPLHPRKRRQRGFNQSALLARPIAKALAIPLQPSRVQRIRDTLPQSLASETNRATNLRGAFRARANEKQPRVLLIDDVQTTGHTLRATEEALRRAGVAHVHALTLAMTL